jgi:hypothetical protein
LILSPLRLFSPARLDLVVKLLYFESLIEGGPDREQAERLYCKHIEARTAGVEPPDFLGRASAKRDISDYLAGCRDLLRSMQAEGFDKRFPIPVNPSNGLLNGSHRVACAAALGLDIVIERHDYDAGRWDFQGLRDAGFTPEELCRVLGRYFDLFLGDSAIAVLWGPALRYWGQMSDSVGPSFETVGHVDIGFSHREAEAFASLVYDIYALETDGAVDDLPNITRKVDLLLQAPTVLRVLLLRHTGDGESQSSHAKETKARLRMVAHPEVPSGDFITCHISDSREESSYLADVLLNGVNIDHVRLRLRRSPRREFLDWILACRRKVASMGLKRSDVCVVGSGTLEATSIRNATDLDFTVTSEVRAAYYGPGAQSVGDSLDVVTEGYHRTEGPWLPDDELISKRRNFFICRGVKFARIEVVRDRKAFSRRDKDLIDVDLIDRAKGTSSPPGWAGPKASSPEGRSASLPRRSSHAIRLAVTYDMFRNRDVGLAPVAMNARWLHALLRQANWQNSVQVDLYQSKADGGAVDTAAVYDRLGLPQSPDGWARMVSTPLLASVPELADFRTADVIVGFGLTPALHRTFDHAGMRVLDIEISPFRFGRTRYFRARTNCPILASALQTIAVPDEEFDEEAQLLAARLATTGSVPAKSRSIGVTFGQSDIDLALVADGRTVSLNDTPFVEQVADLASTVDELHLVPHPNVQRNPENLRRLIAGIPNATLESRPAYAYMACPQTRFAVALSSSTLSEAARFGVPTHRLIVPDRDRPELLPAKLGRWMDVRDDLFSPAFWQAVLLRRPSVDLQSKARQTSLVDAVLGENNLAHLADARAPSPCLAVEGRHALSLDGSGVDILRYGWHHPEAWGTWSSGHFASLSFYSDSDDWRSAEIELEIFAPDPNDPPEINVRTTESRSFAPLRCTTTAAGQVLICDRHPKSGGGLFNITFQIPSPLTPARFGSPDDRLLGVGVKAITLRRTL